MSSELCLTAQIAPANAPRTDNFGFPVLVMKLHIMPIASTPKTAPNRAWPTASDPAQHAFKNLWFLGRKIRIGNQKNWGKNDSILRPVACAVSAVGMVHFVVNSRRAGSEKRNHVSAEVVTVVIQNLIPGSDLSSWIVPIQSFWRISRTWTSENFEPWPRMSAGCNSALFWSNVLPNRLATGF